MKDLLYDGRKVRMHPDIGCGRYHAIAASTKGSFFFYGRLDGDRIPEWATLVFLSPEDYAALSAALAPDEEEAVQMGAAA